MNYFGTVSCHDVCKCEVELAKQRQYMHEELLKLAVEVAELRKKLEEKSYARKDSFNDK